MTKQKGLKKQCFNIMMDLTNETQLNTYLQINLQKLTQICDHLYNPQSTENVHAEHILKLLITVRLTAGSLVPKDLVLPLLLRKSKSKQLNSQWLEVKTALEKHNVPDNLIEIIGFAVYNFENARERPNWSEESYLSFYLDALQDFSELEELDEIVIY